MTRMQTPRRFGKAMDREVATYTRILNELGLLKEAR